MIVSFISMLFIPLDEGV